MNPNDDIKEQMDKDFEDYKKKMAEGAYPEAEDVEEDVRKMKEVNPDASEEGLRKLAVSSIAATKRLKQWRAAPKPPPLSMDDNELAIKAARVGILYLEMLILGCSPNEVESMNEQTFKERPDPLDSSFGASNKVMDLAVESHKRLLEYGISR